MLVRRQRATTSKTYAMDKCYLNAVKKVKRTHSYDRSFYMTEICAYFVNITNGELYRYDKLTHEAFILCGEKWCRDENVARQLDKE